MKTMIFGLGLVALLNSGCAFSRTETPVKFSPKVHQPLAYTQHGRLEIGTFKDSRLVQDANVLFHKTDGYNRTASGAYVTKEAVATILQKGLADTLKENGFSAVSGKYANYELRGDLRELASELIEGFWSGTAKVRITVQFELVDKNTDRWVWRDGISGSTTQKASLITADFVGKLFDEAADDLAKQLIADKTFRSYFE